MIIIGRQNAKAVKLEGKKTCTEKCKKQTCNNVCSSRPGSISQPKSLLNNKGFCCTVLEAGDGRPGFPHGEGSLPFIHRLLNMFYVVVSSTQFSAISFSRALTPLTRAASL